MLLPRLRPPLSVHGIRDVRLATLWVIAAIDAEGRPEHRRELDANGAEEVAVDVAESRLHRLDDDARFPSVTTYRPVPPEAGNYAADHKPLVDHTAEPPSDSITTHPPDAQ